MRSNIARTESAGRVPEPAAMRRWTLLRRFGVVALDAAALALERGEEVDHRRLLLLGEAREGRHRSGRIVQRAPDGALVQDSADLGQVRTEVTAVLADLVAGEAAGLGHDELALLVLGRDLHLDHVRRTGRRAEVGE